MMQLKKVAGYTHASIKRTPQIWLPLGLESERMMSRDNSAGSSQVNELVSQIRKLQDELEKHSFIEDDYGVQGSTFRICAYCGAETGAGLFDKGFTHEKDCILFRG
jgi:hypothetical protein